MIFFFVRLLFSCCSKNVLAMTLITKVIAFMMTKLYTAFTNFTIVFIFIVNIYRGWVGRRSGVGGKPKVV